ncbi:hypothetical protein [Faecalibacterium prausnitzii]|uniref:hypothetical protein n=1 Tax=Faecalibacterium prausnitzii TaxID=853 RepID=UPI0022E379F9|nr:hypothetical protein [Faecalibacterium prausnitzii]
MKLFKKLAAAVLAAALALTMVGCGGNSYAMQDELLKITIDNLTDVNETVTHTKKADEMAAALLAAADTAAAQEANNGKDAKELLLDPAVIKAAKIDLEKTPCMFNPIDVDSQIKSSGVMGEFLKMQWMANAAGLYRFVDPGTFNPGDNKVEIGAATHKIGDKSYTLILITYTPTTTPANPL